jgi:acyl-CoA thioesterase FadM
MPPSEPDNGLLPADTQAHAGDGGMIVRHHVTVEWGDCDPAGIIYYPTYFKWWDQGAWRLFWAVGIDRRLMRTDLGGVEIPILNAEGTFQSTVTPGDRLVVESRVERWGNSSFRVAHKVTGAEGRAVAYGHEVRCWVTNSAVAPGQFRSTRIPDDIVVRFGGQRV